MLLPHTYDTRKTNYASCLTWFPDLLVAAQHTTSMPERVNDLSVSSIAKQCSVATVCHNEAMFSLAARGDGQTRTFSEGHLFQMIQQHRVLTSGRCIWSTIHVYSNRTSKVLWAFMENSKAYGNVANPYNQSSCRIDWAVMAPLGRAGAGPCWLERFEASECPMA